MTPKGRRESSRGNLTDWVRLHDRYDAGGYVDTGGQWHPAKGEEGACCH